MLFPNNTSLIALRIHSATKLGSLFRFLLNKKTLIEFSRLGSIINEHIQKVACVQLKISTSILRERF